MLGARPVTGLAHYPGLDLRTADARPATLGTRIGSILRLRARRGAAKAGVAVKGHRFQPVGLVRHEAGRGAGRREVEVPVRIHPLHTVAHHETVATDEERTTHVAADDVADVVPDLASRRQRHAGPRSRRRTVRRPAVDVLESLGMAVNAGHRPDFAVRR